MNTAIRCEDIVYMDRPISRHPKMSLQNRAKLFTPFAALRGFDIKILTQERDQLLSDRSLLADDEQESIRTTLAKLQPGTCVSVTSFQSVTYLNDTEMGEYVQKIAVVKKLDNIHRMIVLENSTVRFEDLLHIDIVQN